ncbi:hypothetical protein FKR81_14045 [Lentzea tibetensis]|uniref:Streptogrisin C n=1 Tax=Lentzea tibetensis TaxID=2591470 RepID=A0A563EWC6_9PSEU|nr:hypothetical protein [Lentzea tibetensis]TWP51953.1 hypothetical protein FKR81_14045 [Lentzea tibetensis]
MSRNKSRICAALITAATGLALGLVPATADVTKTPGKGPAPVLEDPRFSAQAEMDRVTDRLRPLAENRPEFAGFRFDHAARKVTLRWKGAVPAQIKTMAHALAVDLKPAAYSRADLLKAAKAFADQPPAIVAGRVTRVGPLPDMSGLEYAICAQDVVAAEAQAMTFGDIPVRLSAERSERAVASARWADTPPFWAGAAMEREVSGGYTYCTTSFAIRRNQNPDAMLTAWHCGQRVDWHTPDGNNEHIGRSETGVQNMDANILTGRTYDPAIYTGSYNNGAGDGRTVAGSGNPGLDSYVFASGSFSGASTLRVTAVDQFFPLENQGNVGPAFRTLNEEGVASVGQGDSGGPTGAPFNNDFTRVSARGIISAITPQDGARCTGLVYNGRRCSTIGWHINVVDAARAFGGTVKTG